jgi:hypothetical protein
VFFGAAVLAVMVLSAALVSVSCRSGDGQDTGGSSQPPVEPPGELPAGNLPSTEEPAAGIAMAEGGDLSFVQSGSYWDEVHVFTADGTLKVNRATDAGTVRVLVVAGGGGGGRSDNTNTPGSGGGAGGLIMENGISLTASSYTVAVGAGGPGGNRSAQGSYTSKKEAVETYNGEDSSIAGTGIDLTAVGGGGGAWHGLENGCPGGDGGSGGGGYGHEGVGRGVGGQGHDGGEHGGNGCAGGGGAGGSGGNNNGVDNTGTGGPGLAQVAIPAAIDVRNIPAVFAEGGAGGLFNPVVGETNTGNGGGGGVQNSLGLPGGSGIVIVRFQHTRPAP